ncbi:hypothetical protein LXL04_030527 [Taraxacum kok-saghyz]
MVCWNVSILEASRTITICSFINGIIFLLLFYTEEVQVDNEKQCGICKYELHPIEKNRICMHMTCNPPCKYEFCWLCFGQCNRYESAKQEVAVIKLITYFL